MVEINSYNALERAKNATGVNLPDKGSSSSSFRWRSDEDRLRVESYKILTKLFRGKHLKDDGGSFSHPYGLKSREEDIPYIQSNMLAKIVRIFKLLRSCKSLSK